MKVRKALSGQLTESRQTESGQTDTGQKIQTDTGFGQQTDSKFGQQIDTGHEFQENPDKNETRTGHGQCCPPTFGLDSKLWNGTKGYSKLLFGV